MAFGCVWFGSPVRRTRPDLIRFKFDDETVTPCSEYAAIEDNYGGDGRACRVGYVLQLQICSTKWGIERVSTELPILGFLCKSCLSSKIAIPAPFDEFPSLCYHRLAYLSHIGPSRCRTLWSEHGIFVTTIYCTAHP